MAYTESDWSLRGTSRMDYGSQITHLTRSATQGGQEFTALDIVIKMLRERRIIGSTTASGFIIGDQPAVCFQDAPPYSICENIDFEWKLKKEKKLDKFRYEACGLMFQKPYIYRKGGRPVIYEKKEIATRMLPREEWWRIVNFDLSDPKKFIDWTHEREWRIPGDFEFEIDKATVVVMNAEQFKLFHTISAQGGEDVAKMVSCILPLGTIFV
ncbi:MAG: DUF2971 domain-containing protein [Deltaproteobacteria bacterium]|nr:DUF2971 domain-containing protein [Deltaproteobacteria bacterium]